MSRFQKTIFCLAFVLFAVTLRADAQDDLSRELLNLSQSVETLDARLDTATSEQTLSELRFRLQDTRIQLMDIRTTLERRREQVTADLEGLGPEPETGSEPQSVAQLRADYLDRQTTIAEQAALANALLQRVDRMQTRSAEELRNAFLDRIFARAPPAYMPASLAEAGDEAVADLANLRAHFNSWLAQLRERDSVLPTVLLWAGGLAGLVFLVFPIRDFLAERLWRQFSHDRITRPMRSAIAITRASTRILLAALGLYILYRIALDTGLSPGPGAAKPEQILLACFLFAAINAVSLASYSPGKPHWRLTGLNDEQAWKAHTLALSAGGVYTIDQTLRALWGAAEGGTALLRLESLVAAIVFAAIVLLFRRRLPKQRKAVGVLFVGFAFAPLVACLLGYTPLARFAMEKTAQIAVFLGYVYLIRAVLQSWLRLAISRLVIGETHSEDGSDDDDMIAYWIGASIDLLLIAAVLPVALAILGMNWAEILALSLSLLGGFTLGTLTISPSSIVYAILLILVILLGTRITQRVLDRRILAAARVNPGVRNSLKTLIGYAGLVVAIFVGVSAMGLDLSSLAIIAGALSVGIGFGLQSIVNNFVSGLILLIERPIKIGDWVITASGEGIVKRINVRSTEIETFDRCSIIVPNSELISSTVQNWTHRDNMARIRVPIGVSYKSDPEHVRRVLEKVCEEYDGILKDPEPYIYFDAFADSSLNFEVRAFIREASLALVTRNDLRHRIFHALADAGIEIPFPQRVVHLPGDSKPDPDPA